MRLFGNRPARREHHREDLYEEALAGDVETSEDEEAEGRFSLPSWAIILISAILTMAVVMGIGALIINHYLSLINYQSADSEYFPTVEREEDLPEDEAINEELAAIDKAEAGLEATPEELAEWNARIENVVSDDSTYEVPISQDVYNILLIGSDTRERGGVGRSDAMILVSINQKTETIYLTSFLRDCYVHVPGWGNTRLNHAFAYDGPDLLEQTLEENLKVHVDRYAAVDFFSFMDVIDILGGVWINVSEDERKITDDYIFSMNKLMDLEWSTDYLWQSGWQKLNGKQALCYARNRYTGNDFDRTQRQRTIISQILVAAKSASPATLVELAQVILPQITTDMTKTQLLNYAANASAYANYQLVSQQIPAAGTYHGATISGMSVISMDLEENIEYLQGTIYAGTEYGFPIQEVQTSESFGGSEEEDPWADYDPAAFWGREEWADIEWDRVDFDQVDWYTIDYDTVNWEDYYKDEDPAASAKPSASPTTSAKPSNPFPSIAPSASPSPTASAKPSSTPKPSASPSPSPSPSASPSVSPSAPAIAPPTASEEP